MKVYNNQPKIVTYIGWNDKIHGVATNCDLGRGVLCKHGHGIRRAIYDTAFGYVNGFRKRDILYYVLTRSLSKRVWKLVLARNDKRGDNDYPYASLPLEMRDFVLKTGKSF
jgi:hypothetical protein